jgi:LacI family transcriptional regulator
VKKITQEDIARELNISLKTVQRAFNDPGSVSKNTRDQIVSFAKQSGYKIDRAAQALQRKNVQRIAILSSESPRYFWDDLETGIAMAREQIEYLGFRIYYYRLGSSDTEAFLDTLRMEIKLGTRAFGLANHIGIDMNRVIELLKEHDLPFAAYNIDFPTHRKIAYIGGDYRNQGRIAGEFTRKIRGQQSSGRIIILNSDFTKTSILPGADIDSERLEGFLSKVAVEVNAEIFQIPIIRDWKNLTWDEIKPSLPPDLVHDDIIYCIAPFPNELLQYFSTLPQNNRPRIIGHDLSPDIDSYLREGIITAEIYQNPVLQGYGIVKILENYLESENGETDREYLITSEIILSSNTNQKNNLDIISRINRES